MLLFFFWHSISGGGQQPIKLDDEDELVAGIVGEENPTITGLGGIDTSHTEAEVVADE